MGIFLYFNLFASVAALIAHPPKGDRRQGQLTTTAVSRALPLNTCRGGQARYA